jgi:hypothetical protein
MGTPPLEVIESWPAPNYVDPETRGQSVLVVNITLLGLCLIALAARLWSRLVILRAPGLDDLLITIAIVSSSRRKLQHKLISHADSHHWPRRNRDSR